MAHRENYQQQIPAYEMWGESKPTPLLVGLYAGAVSVEVGMGNTQATENSPTL